MQIVSLGLGCHVGCHLLHLQNGEHEFSLATGSVVVNLLDARSLQPPSLAVHVHPHGETLPLRFGNGSFRRVGMSLAARIIDSQHSCLEGKGLGLLSLVGMRHLAHRSTRFPSEPSHVGTVVPQFSARFIIRDCVGVDLVGGWIKSYNLERTLGACVLPATGQILAHLDFAGFFIDRRIGSTGRVR